MRPRHGTVSFLVAAALLGSAALTPAAVAAAAPAKTPCSALDDVAGPLDDIEFDLGNLKVVLNNVYAVVDEKRHDEEFRLNNLRDDLLHLTKAVALADDPGLRHALSGVQQGFKDLDTAVHDQFVVVDDSHYDTFSGINYSSPRLSGGTPPSPEAWGAADALNEDRQAAADVADTLREGCTG